MATSATLARKTMGATGVIILACLANIALFGFAPLLVSEIEKAGLPEPLRMVAVFNPEMAPPTPPDQPPPPEPPEVIKKLEQIKPDNAPMNTPQPNLEMASLDLPVTPEIQGGPMIGAPPALPKPAAVNTKFDRGPLLTGRIPPQYPYMAKRRGVEGWVKVRFLVNTQGKAIQLSIIQADPTGVFEESVMRAVPRWRFKPALKEGKATEAWMETTIRFELQ